MKIYFKDSRGNLRIFETEFSMMAIQSQRALAEIVYKETGIDVTLPIFGLAL